MNKQEILNKYYEMCQEQQNEMRTPSGTCGKYSSDCQNCMLGVAIECIKKCIEIESNPCIACQELSCRDCPIWESNYL